MLRLPPLIRTAVASRTLSRTNPPLSRLPLTQWTDMIPAKPHGVFRHLGFAARLYATVHSDGLDKMWRTNGQDPAIKTKGDDCSESANLPDPVVGRIALLEQRLNSLELSEAQEILTNVRKKLRERRPTRASKLRRKVDAAINASDPLPKLRKLAELHRISSDETQSPKQTSSTIDKRRDSGVSTSETATVEQIQLLDLPFIQRTMPLPTKDQYPNAVAQLFDPSLIAVAINNQCQKQRLSKQVDLDFTPKQGFKDPGFVCTMKLDIPDVCTVTAVGEGRTQQAARQAAWAHSISRMHTDGSLKTLFPEKRPTSASNQVKIAGDDIDLDLEPAELDEHTKREERDAKTEIYEYAASLGLIPVFEANIVRSRRQRIANQSDRLWQVRIRLDGRNIDVSAVGRDVHTAEVAAALAFKKEAEKQHGSMAGPATSEGRRILTAETAKKFFDFYKSRVRSTDLTIEHETQSRENVAFNTAKVLMHGSQVGQEVFMPKKAKAEMIAYLTAAVELTTSDPALLKGFEQTIIRGPLLRPVKPIDLSLNPEVADSMRETLLEARKAGLSDIRRVLGAESEDPTQKMYPPRARLSQNELRRRNGVLMDNLRQFEIDPRLQDLRATKAALPMTQWRDEVLSMVSGSPHSIIVGATGSGKTTQVPQILFEDAIRAGNGATCNIICTQPRRIAATSVARRVAAERNERLRSTVGHVVRFDSRPPLHPFGITYCTTGVLLERLKNDPDEVLDTTSHICIDEVHERDLQIDFLMIALKRAIEMRQSEGKSIPKIILMSATLDIDLFANYFGIADENGKLLPCPALTVPGRTFPVEERHLSSIMDEMREEHGVEIANLLKLSSGTEEYMAAEGAFSASQQDKNASSRMNSIIDWKGERQALLDADADMAAAQEKEESLVPVSLLATTIAHICKTTNDGAILAFVPGLREILDTRKLLLNFSPLNIDFNDQDKYRVYPLHSTSTHEDQAEIFNSLPQGCRKIILATNIAETSVTVADVKYVVDTGKLREVRYDQVRRITKLQCVWVSKSNAKQRAGRAGRVQDGYYYALYSKERGQSLRAIGQPELLRSDLQETCLAIKSQNFRESAASFLARAIEPPTPQAVSSSIQNLVDIEALTSDESLTALGRVLSKIPVYPSLGKMIILGVIFRCLDPMITLGAAVDERPLFVSPIDRRPEAAEAHNTYAPHDESDQLALLEAFQDLRMVRYQYGRDAAQDRAREKFLHWGAFSTIDRSARAIEDVLINSGLIPLSELDERYVLPSYGPASLNTNSQNSALIKSLLVAGLTRNVAVKTSPSGIMYRTPREYRVMINPGSRNSEQRREDAKHPASTLFTYGELAKSNTGDSLLLRDATKITPLTTLLFGGQLRLTETGNLEMDGWLPFNVKYSDQKYAAQLILEFRKALDRVLHRAFESLETLEPDGSGRLANDPLRDNFVNRVVQILNLRDRFSEEAFQEWRNLLRQDGT